MGPILLGLALLAAPEAGCSLLLEERVAARVSRPAALALVRELVGYGPRMGGTASGDRAAAAVARRMRDLGLPVEVIEDPELPVHEERAWTVRLEDRELASAWPYGFSPPIAETTAPLASDTPGRPQGEEPATETGGRLRGAVVLTSRRVTDVYDAMVSSGAIALLAEHPSDPNRFLDWTPIGRLRTAGGGRPPIPVFGLSYRDGRLLRQALAGPRRPEVTLWLDASLRTGRPRTVVGTLAGAGSRAEQFLIVCAHGDSDSGGPGADDNASGVAALIEVARALTWAEAAGLLPADRPAVKFIVWGAEYHSSGAYVTSRPGRMRRLKAVFNFDQAGTGAERDAVYYEGNEIAWNAPLLRTIESVAEDHAGRPGFWTIHTSVPALGGTDAYAFLPARHSGMGLTPRKIPATTIFTAAWGRPVRVAQTPGWRSNGWPEKGDLFIDYSPYYHSSGDVPARTTEAEPYNIERCARLVALTVLRLMAPGG